jgi:hypothetical protein
MKESDLAYVAGLFDGDGCIYIKKNLPSALRRMKNPGYEIAVAIANTYPPILKELKNWFGGTIKKTKRKKDNHSILYQWGLTSKSALPFLRMVYPYLRIKKEQVMWALLFEDYRETLNPHKGRKGYSEEEIACFELIKIRVQELKKYGSES